MTAPGMQPGATVAFRDPPDGLAWSERLLLQASRYRTRRRWRRLTREALAVTPGATAPPIVLDLARVLRW